MEPCSGAEYDWRTRRSFPALYVCLAVVIVAGAIALGLLASPSPSRPMARSTERVPDLIGLTPPTAYDVLDGTQLVLGRERDARIPSTLPTAIVLGQFPAAGTTVIKGSKVGIVVHGSGISPSWHPYVAIVVVTAMASRSLCSSSEPTGNSDLRIDAAVRVSGPLEVATGAPYRWTLCFVTRRWPPEGRRYIPAPLLGQRIQLFVSEPNRNVRALDRLYGSTAVWIVQGINGPVRYVMTPV